MNVPVGAGVNTLILVRVVSRSSSEVFSTPTLAGVTFSLIATPLAGRGQHTDRLYGAFGSWSAGNVVLGFSQSVVHAAMAEVFPDNGVDPTTPYSFVKYRNTNGDSGAGSGGTDTTAPTIGFSNTDAEQRMVVHTSTRNRQLNASPADADYTREGDVSSGTGGSDQALACESRVLSPAGADTWAGATSIAVDWIVDAILVNPVAADTTPPEVDVTAGPTPARISAVSGFDESDFTFEVDEGCQAWELRAVGDASDPRDTGDPLVLSGGAIPAETGQPQTVSYDDLDAAGIAGSDGPKTLKVFAQDAAGNWSE